ncbi:hypothetical protein DH2020_004070 [Rehmannia glutinosa]|uniref:Tf2-1-like SH3-like domain-containing protein n=1 Tax=Rehmannia glutinosa TaxID=99300 RepID=A0ABR0XNM7_REHGL
MAPYEALYGRKCRSPAHWDEVGERKIFGPEIIEKTVGVIAKIRDRIKAAQDRQKSYADRRRKDLQFEVLDKVFLKVAPLKRVVRFGKKGKLRPRYIGPFEILDRIGDVAYRLALPPELAAVHNVFHVSRLKKYQPDPEHVITHDTPPLMENLSYTERPIRIIDQQIRQLRKREIPMVKVVWQNHNRDEDATWEMEEDIRNQYPELF